MPDEYHRFDTEEVDADSEQHKSNYEIEGSEANSGSKLSITEEENLIRPKSARPVLNLSTLSTDGE